MRVWGRSDSFGVTRTRVVAGRLANQARSASSGALVFLFGRRWKSVVVAVPVEARGGEVDAVGGVGCVGVISMEPSAMRDGEWETIAVGSPEMGSWETVSMWTSEV